MAKKAEVEAPAVEAQTEPQNVQDVQEVITQTSGGNDGNRPQAQTERTFTQSELNAIVQQRLQQERGKYAGFEQMQAELEQLRQQQTESSQTAQELQQRNQQLSEQNRTTAQEKAIIAAASKIGLDGEAAIKLMDTDKIQTNEAGELTNAADVVKDIVDRYPGLVRRGLPIVNAVNPATANQTVVASERLARQRREYFGIGTPSMWDGGGVRMPAAFDE